MNNDAIKAMYSIAKSEGYTKSEAEFINGMTSNPEMVSTMYSLAQKEGYTKDVNQFKTLFGESNIDPWLQSDGPLGNTELSMAAQANPRDTSDKFDPYLNKDIFESKWNAMPIEGRAKMLSEARGISYDNALSQVMSLPNMSYSSMLDIKDDGSENRLKRIYPATKDLLGSAGRAVGAGVDQLLDIPNASKENFAKSYAEIGGNVPQGEERGFVGGLAQSLVRDPLLVPLAGGATAATKIPAVASKLAQTGKYVRPATLAAEGFAEETAREGVEGAFGAKDFDASNAAINIALGTGAGVGLDKLGGIAKNRAKKTFNNNILKPNAPKKFKPAKIEEAYQQLPTTSGSKRPLYDYDLPTHLQNIGSKITDLGSKKGSAYKELSEFDDLIGSEINNPAASLFDRGSIVSDNIQMESFIDESLEKEANRVMDLVSRKKMSREAAQEYMQELTKLKTSYGQKLEFTGEGANVVDMFSPDAVKATQKNVTNPNDIFNARKTLDTDNQAALDKLGKDKKIKAKDDAVYTFRRILNDAIEGNTDRIKSAYKGRDGVLNKNGEKLSLSDIINKVDETKPLESLYSQRDIVQDVGGGRIGGVTTNRFSQGSIKDLAKLGFPASGIRTRQAGELAQNPTSWPIFKSAYRYNEEN